MHAHAADRALVGVPQPRETPGVMTVSARLQRRVARDFPEPGSSEEIVRLLADASDCERVQAAIIFAANGDLREFKRETQLAMVDWRDVLMNGGLAHDDWPDVLDAELGPNRTS